MITITTLLLTFFGNFFFHCTVLESSSTYISLQVLHCLTLYVTNLSYSNQSIDCCSSNITGNNIGHDNTWHIIALWCSLNQKIIN